MLREELAKAAAAHKIELAKKEAEREIVLDDLEAINDQYQQLNMAFETQAQELTSAKVLHGAAHSVQYYCWTLAIFKPFCLFSQTISACQSILRTFEIWTKCPVKLPTLYCTLSTHPSYFQSAWEKG